MKQASYIIYPGLGGDIPTAMRIIGMAAMVFDVTVEQMKGKKRKRQIADSRHVALFVIRKRTSLSLECAAKLLCRKDHTTCSHAVKKIEDLADIDHALGQKVKYILRQFDHVPEALIATENREL